VPRFTRVVLSFSPTGIQLILYLTWSKNIRPRRHPSCVSLIRRVYPVLASLIINECELTRLRIIIMSVLRTLYVSGEYFNSRELNVSSYPPKVEHNIA